MSIHATKEQNSDGCLALEHAWCVLEDLYQQAIPLPTDAESVEIERELLFCLLGGFGITYEHGRSASEVLWRLRPFSEEWDDDELFDRILWALMQSQFEPTKAGGGLRRFRFPRRKAAIIVQARDWLRGKSPLYQKLVLMQSCSDRRRFLSECPGVGLKTASWLLRNLGLGAELATVDVHIWRALSEAGRVPDNVRMPRDYELVEEAFLEWCHELDAPPAAFDLFVWHWQRGALVNTR